MRTWEKIINFIFIALALAAGAVLVFFHIKNYEMFQEMKSTFEGLGDNSLNMDDVMKNFWLYCFLQVAIVSLLPLSIFLLRLFYYRVKWFNVVYYVIGILYFLFLCLATLVICAYASIF